jgi:hypothetical protein
MKYCTAYGIRPLWGLLIGSPGEPENVYAKYCADLQNIVHLPPPTGVFTVKFHRYTPYWKTPEQFKLKLRPHDHYSLVYPFDDDTLHRLAYEFVDDSLADYKVAAGKWLTALQQHVQAWQARWHDSHEQPKLMLADPYTVIDTRANPAEYRLTGVGSRLLALLANPMRLNTLATELHGVSDSELAAELKLMRQRRLLFEEGDRALSLVLSREPVPMKETLSGSVTENAQGTRVRRSHFDSVAVCGS